MDRGQNEKYNFLFHEQHIMIVTLHKFHEESDTSDSNRLHIFLITLHAVAPYHKLQGHNIAFMFQEEIIL